MEFRVEEPNGDMAICEAHEGSKFKGARGCSRVAKFIVFVDQGDELAYLSEKCVGPVMLQLREG